jgi:hypothetical protein
MGPPSSASAKRDQLDHITDVETLQEIEFATRENKAGRYHVDEISGDTLPSGHPSRRWGIVIKWRDKAVFLESDPWPE